MTERGEVDVQKTVREFYIRRYKWYVNNPEFFLEYQMSKIFRDF